MEPVLCPSDDNPISKEEGCGRTASENIRQAKSEDHPLCASAEKPESKPLTVAEGPEQSGQNSGHLKAENLAMKVSAATCGMVQKTRESIENKGLLQHVAEACQMVQNNLLRPAGVEPATFGFVVRRSIQLSYERLGRTRVYRCG